MVRTRAATRNDVDEIEFLLKDEGVSPEAADEQGGTALHHASFKGHLESMRLLLKLQAAGYKSHAHAHAHATCSKVVRLLRLLKLMRLLRASRVMARWATASPRLWRQTSRRSLCKV